MHLLRASLAPANREKECAQQSHNNVKQDYSNPNYTQNYFGIFIRQQVLSRNELDTGMYW